MSVIAEGVETPGQMKHLDTLNCDHMQGYLFSQPVNAAAATAQIAANTLRARTRFMS
jgi:EAL domain-containing protein (putative c-di-GMP-specific phosphodiesterase class I)